ncbi:MAG: efflux RND transporter periplasmic adaptor subunit [Saprospiraceae bacterium]|nr:efflux RND transporter periplasmic adaptor subunit [Pyrinomonadaceae bacterium]
MWNLTEPRNKAASKILAGIAFAAFCAACGGAESADGRRGNSNANTENADAPITISVAKTESRQVPAYIQASGSLVADETSNIAPKVAGKVANVYANVGEFVSQGSLIAKIDDRDALLQLSTARANVKQEVAAVRQAEARLGLTANGSFSASSIPEVRSAEALYQQGLAEQRQAEANEKRYRELVETGDVAMVTYEQFKTARDTARARSNSLLQIRGITVNTAKQNNQAIKSAEAAVEAAQTQVATAQQAVADTVIRAPFSGFISDRPVAVGEFVSTATVIATLLRSNPIKIQIQIAEADIPAVQLGRGVSVQVDAFKDRNFAGTVTSVNPALDTTSRSAVVEARIDNGENLLRTGMFGSARIIKEGGGTGIFVPKTAVYNDLSTQSYRAFVVVDGIVKLRVLQLGTEEGDFYQILDGLNADETVATSNLEQLYEGARVSS